MDFMGIVFDKCHNWVARRTKRFVFSDSGSIDEAGTVTYDKDIGDAWTQSSSTQLPGE
jgi:hypothetical protein